MKQNNPRKEEVLSVTVVICEIFSCDNNQNGVCQSTEISVANREAEAVCHSETYMRYIEEKGLVRPQVEVTCHRDN